MGALLLCVCWGKKPIIVPPVPGGGGGGGDDPKPIKQAEIGKPLPAWEKGWFDIHFINTTTGEAVYLIFPDGTQMLIDAAGSQVATGVVNRVTNTGIRARWDPTKESGWLCGEYIANYIKSCQAWVGSSKIDYVLLTHFHNDHFGGASGLPVSDLSPNYVKQSLPYILDNFEVGKLMDRGYPDYNYPFDMSSKADNSANCTNYIKAVKYQVEKRGVVAEKFVAGSNTQIQLLKYADSYPGFVVRNLAINGEIWNGGTGTNKTFPELNEIVVANTKDVKSSDKCPAENHMSCMAKFSFGSFDFFAGGDGQYTGLSSFA